LNSRYRQHGTVAPDRWNLRVQRQQSFRRPLAGIVERRSWQRFGEVLTEGDERAAGGAPVLHSFNAAINGVEPEYGAVAVRIGAFLAGNPTNPIRITLARALEVVVNGGHGRLAYCSFSSERQTFDNVVAFASR
jgi:hypothetical protein